MFEFKCYSQDIAVAETENMGNLFGTALFSEPKQSSTTCKEETKSKNEVVSLPPLIDVEGKEDLLVWCANIEDVPSVADEHTLIRSLLPAEKVKVKRFMFPDDQKRALLSVLLQRAMIRKRFGITDGDYELRRSKEVSLLICFVPCSSSHSSFNFVFYFHRASLTCTPAEVIWTFELGTSMCHIMESSCVLLPTPHCW